MAHRLLFFVAVQIILGTNESQSASAHLKTTKEVTTGILQTKEIFPSPRLSVGHLGGEDKEPLTPKKEDKQKVDKPKEPITKEMITLLGDVSNLNQLQLSKREARVIIGALDRQTCFAKVVCGLGNQVPSKNTDVLNDYAYLIGQLLTGASEEKINPQKEESSLLTDLWEYSEAKESLNNDDKSDEEEDDNVDPTGDRFGLDEYRVLHGKVKPFQQAHYSDEGHINHQPLPPQFAPIHHHHHPVPPRRHVHIRRRVIRPKILLGRVRLSRQLAQSRQCRQLEEKQNKYQCPYDDKQMGNIVKKLRQTIRGESSVLGTIGTGVRSGASQAMSLVRDAANTLKSNYAPDKMNVVINLHQNLTMPQAQHNQMPGFAALPLALSGFYGSSSSSLLRSNESNLHHLNRAEDQKSGGNEGFKPFYIVPLGLPTSSALPPVSSPPTEPTPTTTTIEPFQQLLDFLYSVGYANKTENVESTIQPTLLLPQEPTETQLTLTDLAILSQAKQKEGDKDRPDEEGSNSDESEENKSISDKIKSFYADKDGFVRIKSSHRTGRFHRMGEQDDDQQNEGNYNYQPYPQIPQQDYQRQDVPIFYRAWRFLSYLVSGGRVMG